MNTKLNVAIIDYDLGNILSLSRAIETLGYNPIITNSKTKIDNCGIVILPGVGSFEKGIQNMTKYNLKNIIQKKILQGDKMLGICLGMQLFFEYSEESTPSIRGLNLINGNVLSLRKKIKDKKSKIPHIGWTSFDRIKKNKIFKNINKNDFMYYIHSFFTNPKDKNMILSNIKYFNVSIPSIIKFNNIYGFQFHPEKSGKKGLILLNNFLNEKD